MNAICQGCKARPRRATQYLCSSCWPQLSSSSRRRLMKKDGYAMKRVQELYRELEKGTPIQDIQISL